MSGCEPITKGYLNNFATAIVGDIIINENNDLLLKKNNIEMQQKLLMSH